MFKNFVLLAVAFVFMTGCATTKQNQELNFRNDTVIEEISQLSHPFFLVYGEYGEFVHFEPEFSPAEYGNIAIALMEPGFVVIIDNEAKESGFDSKLEEILKKENFNLVGTKQHGDKKIWQLNFAKQGKRVVFVNS